MQQQQQRLLKLKQRNYYLTPHYDFFQLFPTELFFFLSLLITLIVVDLIIELQKYRQ